MMLTCLLLRKGNQQVETANEELSVNSQADVVINQTNHQNIEDPNISTIPSTSMFNVSAIFDGICEKKVRQNFGYLKLQINPDFIVREMQALKVDIISDNMLAELSDIQQRHKKADRLLKYILRKGESACKCFLESFQGASIQASFVLENLRDLPEKSVPASPAYNIDIQDIHEHYDDIVSEIENADIVDSLLEYYILTLDEHDKIIYTDKPNKVRNSDLILILLNKRSDNWIPGFTLVLKDRKYSLLLSLIQHEGQRVHQVFPDKILYDTTYEMAIKVNGKNASAIELKLARNTEIDNLCQQFAKLSVSNIKQGSVLLLTHPISDNTWLKSYTNVKEQLLKTFIYQLITQSDVQNLIRKKIDVAIELNEIKNILENPVWRVKQLTRLTKEQRQIEDNWTYLAEEMDLEKILEYVLASNVMTLQERMKIMGRPARRQQAYAFLVFLRKRISKNMIEKLINELKIIGQTNIADRLKKGIVCIDCLRDTYKDPDNYKKILDELVSSMMLHIVEKCDDKNIPYHIRNILTPECGKSRRNRAHLFMQYILINDEALRSFENVLATTNYIVIMNHTCDGCKQIKSIDAKYDATSPLQATISVCCSFTIGMETDTIQLITTHTAVASKEKKHAKSNQQVETANEELSVNSQADVVINPTYHQNIKKSKHGKNSQKSSSTPNLLESQERVECREKHSSKNRDYSESNLAGQNRLFIAAIDIGTTYSGYAYSARYDVEKDPSNIFCPQWRGDEGLYYKTATAIVFDEHGQFSKFGFEAETYYHETIEDQDDALACYFFNDFKMLLYEKKNDLNKDIDIKDITGKKMKAIKVFSAAIRYLKEHLLDALHKSFVRDSNISNTDIHWVLTVPAIWEMKAKQFMRDAAEMAGILADQLSLALEPEAASLYCRKVPMSIKESELKTLTLLGSGKSYVVLDQGGGTLDVTGHQIEEDNFLKEIFPPNGGSWGGNNVNYEFEKYLEELFTTEVVHKVKRDDPVAYFETVKQFERKKKSFKPKSDADVIFNVSQAFTDVYKKIHKSDLPSEIRIKHGKIRISALRFKEFFNQSIQSITSHLVELFQSPKLQNVNIILAVGGFSESEIIIDSIREHFPNMQLVVPKDPGLAVLKGAVLFGLEPLAVKSRISRYTYGIKIEKEISTEEDERYRTLRKNRQSIKFATDVFEKLVEIGEEIKVGEWQPATEYDPISKDDQEVKIEFYATEEKDPVHVTDPGCMKLGTLNVDLKERTSSNGALKLEINAGGTEIKAVITDENTGKKFKAKFCLP